MNASTRVSNAESQFAEPLLDRIVFAASVTSSPNGSPGFGAGACAGGGGAGADPKWQEVATKLDLAKAYQEMGDKDGARELLNEVVKDGDAAQKSQAEQMLSGLG